MRAVMVMVLVCTAPASACAGEGGGVGWTVSVDTADGTVRVVNTPPEAGARPTVVGDENLRIWAAEQGHAASFGMIRNIAVLQDGRIAVADGQTEEVRLFDPEGTHLRTFGGEGAGPGELRGIQGVHVDHEGLLRVAEQENGRLSVFHPDTGFVRSFPLRVYTYGARGPWRAAIDSAGRTLVASAGQFGEGRYWNILRIYDATMTQVDSVPYYDYTDDIRQDDRPGSWAIPVGRGTLWVRVPFYAYPQETLSPEGEFWTSAQGEQELEVARWTPPGDTTLILVSRRPPVPVTAAERDSAMAEVSSRLEGRIPHVPNLDASKIPDFKPPVAGLSLDDRGRLWVRLTGEADPTLYDIFDRDGTHAETVSLPFQVDVWIPPVTRGDTVWAVATDDLDVQYVVRVRLRPLDDD